MTNTRDHAAPHFSVNPALTEALILRPGDHLVVRIARDISPAEAHEIMDQLGDRFGGTVQVTVICADGLLVYRPDGAA